MAGWGDVQSRLTGAPTPRAELILPPYDGMDADTPPDFMSPTKAPFVSDLLLDRPGKVVQRGPLYKTWRLINAGEVPTGIMRVRDTILVGVRAASDTATRDPWVAPYRKASAASQLARATGRVHRINLVDGSRRSVVGSVDGVPGGSHNINLGDWSYGISFDATAAAVSVNGGYELLRPLWVWDGAIDDTGQSQIYSICPKGGQDIALHLQRIFVLGGRNPSGSGTIQHNTLWWTNPLDGVSKMTDNISNWQDPTSGLVNQIVVGSDDGSDFGVALARVGKNLVIFKRHSMYILSGYSASNFQINVISPEIGCIDPRSVVEYQQGVYFMSDRGFMFYDGAEITEVSVGMRTPLVNQALAMVGDAGVDGGRVQAGVMNNGYIGVNVGKSPAPASYVEPTTTFSGMLYTPRRAWTELTSGAFTHPGPTFYGRTPNYLYAHDDEFLYDLSKVTAPEAATPADRGNDHEGVTPYIIKSRWESRLVKLAAPIMRARMMRVMLDYNFQINGGTDQISSDTPNGWYVKLIRGDGSTLKDEYQVRSQAPVTSHKFRRRDVTRAGGQTNDAQIQVYWRSVTPFTTSGPPVTNAEILGAVLEFMPSTTQRTE